jgi:hypothetical protein
VTLSRASRNKNNGFSLAFLNSKPFLDRIYWINFDFWAFPDERPKPIRPMDGTQASPESGLKLLWVFRSLSKNHVNPVNPV